MFLNDIYYFFKPVIPRRIQITIRERWVQKKWLSSKDIWPIDPNAQCCPKGWPGWPEKKRFALVLTHDVDSSKGKEKCSSLVRLEKSLGFKSSFNFVPEDYPVSSELRDYLTGNGFEVSVHGLTHHGNLFRSKKSFQRKVRRINLYLHEWKAVGFRAPCMYHNLDWTHDLNIEYDSSTFDTDPFEPQPDGLGTIFPLWVPKSGAKKGYVELPYTLPQDFTLFILMRERNIDIWKQKLDWIVERGGMALLLTHPDYMNFGSQKPRYDEYPVKYYKEFLEYIKLKYQDQYWHILPKDLARYWSAHCVGVAKEID